MMPIAIYICMHKQKNIYLEHMQVSIDIMYDHRPTIPQIENFFFISEQVLRKLYPHYRLKFAPRNYELLALLYNPFRYTN